MWCTNSGNRNDSETHFSHKSLFKILNYFKFIWKYDPGMVLNKYMTRVNKYEIAPKVNKTKNCINNRLIP